MNMHSLLHVACVVILAGIIASVAGPAGSEEPQRDQTQRCVVSQPGEVCGVRVTINPWIEKGGPFGGFQSVPGTSYQTTIEITFTPAVRMATITALDPDFPGNHMLAFSGKYLVDSVVFAFDNLPHEFTQSTKSVEGEGIISRILLVPDARDYIAYRDLIIVP